MTQPSTPKESGGSLGLKLRGFARLISAPWTPAEKAAQAREIDVIASYFAGRGTFNSGMRIKAQDNALSRLRRERLSTRTLALVLLIVVGSSLAEPFTTNRLLDGIQAAAIAAAAPVALILGFRRGSRTYEPWFGGQEQ